jgi:hypothetical protein
MVGVMMVGGYWVLSGRSMGVFGDRARGLSNILVISSY